jgi:hypothetical protein
MTPVEVVERQLIAFNTKDLTGFLATFSEDVCVYEMPHAKPVLVGKLAFKAAYSKPLSNPTLRAEIVSRIQVGNKIVDHERVHGYKPEPYDVVAVYEVDQELIRAMWFFKADDVSSPPNAA